MDKRIGRRSKQTLPPLLSLMQPPPLVAPVATRPPKRAKQQNAGGINPEYVPVVIRLRQLSPERLGGVLRLLTAEQRQLVECVALEGKPLASWCRTQKARRGVTVQRQVEKGKLATILDLLGRRLGCRSESDLAA